MSDIVRQRLREGWYLHRKLNDTVYLLPPDDRKNWGSLLKPVVFDDLVVFVPHYAFKQDRQMR